MTHPVNSNNPRIAAIAAAIADARLAGGLSQGYHDSANRDLREVEAEIARLRAEEKRIKGRLRTARAKLPPEPAVDGELVALRRLREAVEATGYASGARVRKALLALDALPKGAPT